MKKLILIFVAITLIILSACSNSQLKKYPRYMKQKNNIKDLVVASDYAFYNLDMDGITFDEIEYMDSISVHKTVGIVEKLILTRLRNKGYIPSKVYNPTFRAFNGAVPVKAKTDTIHPKNYSKKSKRRIRDKFRMFPSTINRTYFYIDSINKENIYSEIFPAKIDTNNKILRTSDTLTKENMDVAVFFLFRGVSVSLARQLTMALATGVTSGLITGGNFINISVETSYVEIIFLIIDRENNDVIWRDARIEENVDPSDTEEIKDMIEDIIDDLPRLKPLG